MPSTDFWVTSSHHLPRLLQFARQETVRCNISVLLFGGSARPARPAPPLPGLVGQGAQHLRRVSDQGSALQLCFVSLLAADVGFYAAASGWTPQHQSGLGQSARLYIVEWRLGPCPIMDTKWETSGAREGNAKFEKLCFTC